MKGQGLWAGILTVVVVVGGGAAWLSAQSSSVGAGKTVHVMRTPT